MRARLQEYLPLFLFALMVQIIAPIGASWAAAIVASDPLSVAEICRSNHSDQGGQRNEHYSGCSLCCFASASSVADTPALAVFAVPYRQLAGVAWQDQTLDLSLIRVGSHARAREPPFPS